MICNKHKITMTYRAGKENELFCKKCEKKKPGLIKKKKWYQRLKFW